MADDNDEAKDEAKNEAKCAGVLRRRVTDWLSFDDAIDHPSVPGNLTGADKQRREAKVQRMKATWRTIPGAGGVMFDPAYFDAMAQGHLDDVSLLSTFRFTGPGKFAVVDPTWPPFLKWLYEMCHLRHTQCLVGFAIAGGGGAFGKFMYESKPFDAAAFASGLVAAVNNTLGDKWDGISFDIEMTVTPAQLTTLGTTRADQIDAMQKRYRALYREVAKAIGPEKICAYAPAGAVGFTPASPFTYHNNFPQPLQPLKRPFSAQPPQGGSKFVGHTEHYFQPMDARFEAKNILCRPMIYDGIENSAKDEQFNWYWEVLREAILASNKHNKQTPGFKPGRLPQFQVGVKLVASAGVANTHMTSAEVAQMSTDMLFNATSGVSHFAAAHATWATTDKALNRGAPKGCGVLLQMPLPKPWKHASSNGVLQLGQTVEDFHEQP